MIIGNQEAQFLPFPTQYQDKIYNLPGNKYRVIDFIVKEMVQFNNAVRQTLRKRFSYRYIANRLKINFGNVGRILEYLQAKGFIKILEKGKNKVGTLIQLLFNPSGGDEDFSCTGTTKDEDFSCTGTTNKRNVIYKEKQQHDVVCPPQNNKKEKKSDLPEKPEEKVTSPECNNEVKLSENLPPPPLPGIHKHTVRNCVKILSERGITDLASAITAITQEMKNRTIQNINGYFTELCKTFDFNHSSSSPAPSDQGAAPQETKGQGTCSTAAVAAAAQKENEEKYPRNEKREKSPIVQLKEIEEKYPAEVADIKKKVRIRSSMNTEIIKAALYLAAFRENYPELAVERWKAENGISP